MCCFVQFGGIVWWDGCCYVYCDFCGFVGQQVWKSIGQDDWFVFGVVIGVFEVDCVVFDILQQEFGGFGQVCFGVMYGGCIIVIDIVEIVLVFDQWILCCEILVEMDECVIN